MGKLIVELSDDIHGELKKKAAADQKTLKDIVTGLINEYISTEESHLPSKKKTGICGAWDDKRTAEEIISDIKGKRKWFARRKN